MMPARVVRARVVRARTVSVRLAPARMVLTMVATEMPTSAMPTRAVASSAMVERHTDLPAQHGMGSARQAQHAGSAPPGEHGRVARAGRKAGART